MIYACIGLIISIYNVDARDNVHWSPTQKEVIMLFINANRGT